MKATDLLIGAAIVAVGYLAWSATRPPPTLPPASSSSSSGSTLAGLLATALGSKTANDIGASLTQRFSEAWRGEREWW